MITSLCEWLIVLKIIVNSLVTSSFGVKEANRFFFFIQCFSPNEDLIFIYIKNISI